MKRLLVPVLTLLVLAGVMVAQSRQRATVLAEAPDVRLGEIAGFGRRELGATEAERHVLPADTRIEKCAYEAADGRWFVVTLVIGGKSKNSIHRPELCLPSQGFLISRPRETRAGGVDWSVLTLDGAGTRPSVTFAYTFFNQEGFRTASHLRRVVRDVWDRSILGRIDRWAMVTVHTNVLDGWSLNRFLVHLEESMR